MRAVLATPGYAIDTNTKLTPTKIRNLRAALYQGQPIVSAFRYVGLSTPSASDITPDEAVNITDSGLQLGLIQHCLYRGWVPNAGLGAAQGKAAAWIAKSQGLYPQGCHLTCDLEGVLPGTPMQQVIDHVNAWSRATLNLGYPAMLYVGYDCGIDPFALFHSLLDVHRYYSDFAPRVVSVRGFCVKQFPQTILGGIQVDPDEIKEDDLGDLPTLAAT